MWYLAAAWNPNPRMCSQVRGVVRNFIWSGKAANARAKVKWETLVLPISQGGLGIIDPKTQSKAFLAKLLVRGLAPRGEPWKELLRHKANQTKLPVHGMGPTTQDINWLFAATKLKRPPFSLWKSIFHSWLSVRPGLRKSEPTNSAETLRQPVFGNPLIVNPEGRPLGLSGKSEGNALVNAGHSRIGDLWDSDEEDWKSLSALEMKFHPTNRSNRDLIINSIPWDPATARKNPEVGEWVSKMESDRTVQHCLMDCTPAQQAWKAFHRVWNEWRAPNCLHITWPFILLGEAVFEEDDDPPDLHSYHTGGFTYRRQPLDILRSFLVYYLWSERCRNHFDGQHSLKRVLLQSWEATTEVGMATWRAIRSPSQSRKHEHHISIEQAFRAEWLHGHIFQEGEAAISWRLLPPFYFLDFSND
jgi:hypothetical protein